MKTRHGFVSNSSNSSFILPKEGLCHCQIEKIKNHFEIAPQLGMSIINGDQWDVDDLGLALRLSTNMDNFSMTTFLEKIGVDTSKIDWDY